MGRIKVRVFTLPSNPRKQNSYVVGTVEGGLTQPIGTVRIDDEDMESMTFKNIRPYIECKEEKSYTRRSPLFQEILVMMETCANPFQLRGRASRSYGFGYYADVDQDVPYYIQPCDEVKTLATFMNMTTTELPGDLIVIPHTQIGPGCHKCCDGCPTCYAAMPKVQSTTLQLE